MALASLHRRFGGALPLAAALLLPAGGAFAFPFLDAASEDQVPAGTELAAPDAASLRNQLQLVNGFGAPAGGGWTFVPTVSLQEELTDNVRQAHSPRDWDLVTFLAPGFSLAGSTPRVQMSFSLTPTVSMYARTSSFNSLTDQLSGLASVTVVQDLAYVDVRALSGVQSRYGGIGGVGTVGGSTAAGSGLGANTPDYTGLAGNAQGLNRSNEVQTTSYGVSPYLLRRFGDYGTGKLGASVDVTRSESLSGFAALPIPSGGTNGQTLVTTEEIAQFTTGDILGNVQDSVSADLSRSQSTSQAGTLTSANALEPSNTGYASNRFILNDQVTWQVNRSVAVFASGGHEEIAYGNNQSRPVRDLTWSIGTTLTPGPDSSLTLSYGHQNGFNSLSANGHYAISALTVATVSYGETLGTQLQAVQNQLNLATVSNGALSSGVNQSALFGPTNALAVQDGVFRTTTLTAGVSTTRDRDTYGLSVLMTNQTSETPGAGSGASSSSKTAGLSWLHQMRPDMTVNAAVSYSIQAQPVGTAVTPGNSTSLAVSAGWQYQLSNTVTTSVRYSFSDRSSAVAVYNVYQHILILGISKSF